MKDIFLQRFDSLIKKGESLISGAYHEYNEDWVDSPTFYGWKSSAETVISSLPIDNESYLSAFKGGVIANTLYDAQKGLGVLKAILENIQEGYLDDLEKNIISNTFVNLLEMARDLIDQGYKDPAGVLAGVALEDTLRRIGKENLKDYQDTFSFGNINSKLSKLKIYNDPKRNELNGWYKIRDLANHAKWDEFDEGQVKAMIECTNKLIDDYL